MKFKSQILINASLAQVMKKLLLKENMKFWMKGFQSYELQNGKFFQKGSVAILTLDVGLKKIEMTESILESDLPFTYKASYSAQGVTNVVVNHFEVVDENSTLWKQEFEFKFESIAVKAFSGLVVSLFKKISHSTLNDFKKFVEE